MQHEVVSRAEWIDARARLLLKEKAFTRALDALGAEQRAMPWVKVEKRYLFEGPEGTLTLSDLFAGRSQLFTKHFMLEPGQKTQCVGCSLECDHVMGLLEHLNNHDISYVVTAPAPIAEIEVIRKRMGWTFPWVSAGNEFRLDFQRDAAPPGVGGSGNDIFFKNEQGEIFHTYAVYDRGGEAFLGIYRLLDLMPRGRNENGPYHSLADWVKPRTAYGKGGAVERNGRYHASACSCGGHDKR